LPSCNIGSAIGRLPGDYLKPWTGIAVSEAEQEPFWRATFAYWRPPAIILLIESDRSLS